MGHNGLIEPDFSYFIDHKNSTQTRSDAYDDLVKMFEFINPSGGWLYNDRAPMQDDWLELPTKCTVEILANAIVGGIDRLKRVHNLSVTGISIAIAERPDLINMAQISFCINTHPNETVFQKILKTVFFKRPKLPVPKMYYMRVFQEPTHRNII